MKNYQFRTWRLRSWVDTGKLDHSSHQVQPIDLHYCITYLGSKSAAGSKSANCRLRPHFTIDLYYGIIVFAGFLLLCVTDRANFCNTQIEHKESILRKKFQLFWSEAPLLMALINKVVVKQIFHSQSTENT